MSTLVALLAQFPDPGRDLPDQSGGFRVSPTLFVVAFGIGFMVAIAGHLFRSRTLVAIGIGMIFLSTVLVPIYLQILR
jgi:hypothetical protein